MTPNAEFKVVLIDKITDPARPMRSDLSPESVQSLTSSIRQLGVIEPLVVKPDGDRFEIIAGHRRLLASELADLVEVPCYVVRVTDETADLMKIHENLQRKEISPTEEGKYFEYLVEEYHWSAEKIAKMINRSDAYVYARMAIGDYPDDLRAALEAGQVSIGVARELAQVDDDITRSQYLDYAVKNGITWSVAEQWKREYINNKSAQIPAGNVNLGAPFVQQPVIAMVKCPLCEGELPMKDARLLYCHADCIQKLAAQ